MSSGTQRDLLGARAAPAQPLADRMRPRTPEELAGQAHLLQSGKPLHAMLVNGQLHSAVFWGPPGTGKTTLARLIARASDAHFIALSAVQAGVKDVRLAVAQAQEVAGGQGRKTLLFLDEVHRFNKAQQDAFLPFVEDGTLVFVGATTENPSFELNNALLSRAAVYVLKPLTAAELVAVLRRALADTERGLGERSLTADDAALEAIAVAADGDARRALNLLERAAGDCAAGDKLDEEALDARLGERLRRFDKGGDDFYDQISALHKSVRGSDPDAALYWLCRMLDGGADPRYLGRRLLRIASEDIGNADPRALHLALDALATYERLGSPEGELALAQATIFMACAAKSNATYAAYEAALADVREYGSLPVPMHLRNAPTRLLNRLGHGDGYRYPHDEAGGYAPGVGYRPDDMPAKSYYHPVSRGLEIRIAEKLAALRRREKQGPDDADSG